MLILLFISILLESTVTTLPLVLLIILFLSVIEKSNDVFIIAFFSGLFLDLMSMNRFGMSSLFFTIFVFLIYTYQKKFEIETVHFMAIFGFLGSFFYLILMGSGNIIFQSLTATFMIVSSFLVFKKYNKKAPKYA